ncbi:uridylate kinase [Stenotrophomonas sp. LARHCG68]
MFPDLISPALDFEHQFGACVNAMSQDDAIGQILVFERMRGTLHMRHIASADLVDTDVDDYEMVVFDGGNTSGDTWKHVFFPRQREHYFVYEA